MFDRYYVTIITSASNGRCSWSQGSNRFPLNGTRSEKPCQELTLDILRLFHLLRWRPQRIRMQHSCQKCDWRSQLLDLDRVRCTKSEEHKRVQPPTTARYLELKLWSSSYSALFAWFLVISMAWMHSSRTTKSWYEEEVTKSSRIKGRKEPCLIRKQISKVIFISEYCNGYPISTHTHGTMGG